MEVNCEGCAGCCVDWRALAPDAVDAERAGRYRPLDDVYNLVVLSRDDVRALVEAGLGDAMTPRLFYAEDADRRVRIGDRDLAAIEGRVAFFVGIRKVPKPVEPFDTRPSWLPTCVFLDPTTLQCRIHGNDEFPETCAEFPGHGLALDRETECERVEGAFGGERLVDDEPPGTAGLLLGSGAVGGKVFVYPEFGDDADDEDAPDEYEPVTAAVVERAACGALTPADRARFVAVAAASAPGTTDVDPETYATVVERVRATDSWVGQAAAAWTARDGEQEADPELAREVEEERGAPSTPGWG